ncbi:MAG: hypothetical protein IT385_21235 [Deltaproteobacteria bacterium]|nr:hypothetical protein [Deltaproteobacteria bacterium]
MLMTALGALAKNLPGPAMPTPWPGAGLDRAEILVADRDEQVTEGVLRGTSTRAVVAVRDLGADVSASLWDDEVARLMEIHHPHAAPVIDARIDGDRFVVVTALQPEGTPLRALLARGPLAPEVALTVTRDALRLMAHLHAAGLSAAGLWLRAGTLTEGPRGARLVLSTFGLRVDNDVDPIGELAELAMRVLTTVGGRVARGALSVPPGALAPPLEAALRRALGPSARAFRSAGAMLDALAA